MVSSSCQILFYPFHLTFSSSSSYHTPTCISKLIAPLRRRKSQLLFTKSCFQVVASSCQLQHNQSVIKSLPVAASLTVLLWSSPEENQKQYAEFDKRFNKSPLLKKLLEKSNLNKEKNQQQIQNKYCLRGAEWGVGDCSAEGMTEDEKDRFIAMLKAKEGE